MKSLIVIITSCVLMGTLRGEPASRVVIEGRTYREIVGVSVNQDGLVGIIHGSRSSSFSPAVIPQDFLDSWGVTEEQVKQAKEAGAKAASIQKKESHSAEHAVYSLYKIIEISDRGFIGQVYTFKTDTRMDPSYAMAMSMVGGASSKSDRAARAMGFGPSGGIPTITETKKELTNSIVYVEYPKYNELKEGEDFGGFFVYGGEATISSRVKGSMVLPKSIFIRSDQNTEK
jgi:hypothetical protein